MSFSAVNHCLHAYCAETLAIGIQIPCNTFKDTATASKKSPLTMLKCTLILKLQDVSWVLDK